MLMGNAQDACTFAPLVPALLPARPVTAQP